MRRANRKSRRFEHIQTVLPQEFRKCKTSFALARYYRHSHDDDSLQETWIELRNNIPEKLATPGTSDAVKQQHSYDTKFFDNELRTRTHDVCNHALRCKGLAKNKAAQKTIQCDQLPTPYILYPIPTASALKKEDNRRKNKVKTMYRTQIDGTRVQQFTRKRHE